MVPPAIARKAYIAKYHINAIFVNIGAYMEKRWSIWATVAPALKLEKCIFEGVGIEVF